MLPDKRMPDTTVTKDPTDMTIGFPPSLGAPKVKVPEVSTIPEQGVVDQPVPSLQGAMGETTPETQKQTDRFGSEEKGSLAGSMEFLLPSTHQESAMVRKIAVESADPQAIMDRYNEAKAFQDEYPQVGVFDMMRDLDSYKEDYFGKNKALKTDAKAIWDSTHAGAKAIELGWAGSAAMMSDTPENDARIKKIYDEINELNLDTAPRGVVTQALKTLGNVVPYTGYFMATTAITTMIGNEVAAAANVAGFAKVVPYILTMTKGFSFAQSAAVMAGGDYTDMVMNGVDKKAARTAAATTGVINAAIEQYLGLGLEGGVRKVLTKKAIEETGTKIAARMMASGATKTAGAAFGKAIIGNAVGEMSEEFAQAWISGVGAMTAESLTEDFGNILNPTEIAQVSKQAASAAWTAAWTSLFLGLPVAFGSYFNSKAEAKEISDEAMFSSHDEFVKKAETMDQFSSVPKDQVQEVADMIWKSKQEELGTEKSKRAENAKQQQTEGQSQPVRMQNGALDISETKIGDEGDSQLWQFTAMNADSQSEDYGHITVAINQDTVTLNDATIRPTYEGISDELLQEVAARFPDKKIVLGSIEDNTVIGSYERLGTEIDGGKFIVNPGDTPEVSKAKNYFRTQLSGKAAISPLGTELALNMLQHAMGKDFVNAPNRLTVQRDDSLLVSGNVGSLVASDSALVDQIASKANYIMKLANGANGSTVVHEMLHFARLTSTKKSQLKVLENLYGIVDGKWETQHEERFVNDMMTLMRDGKVSDEKARPFLTHVADFLKRLWKGPLSKIPMSDQVEAALNDFLSAEGELSSPVDENIDTEWQSLEPNLTEEARNEGKVTQAFTEEEQEKIALAMKEVLYEVSDSIAKETESLSIAAADDVSKAISASKLSAFTERERILSNGEWVNDPLTAAYVYRKAGLPLTELMEDAQATALQMGELFEIEDPLQQTLFMSQAELNASRDEKKEIIAFRAAKESTFDDWIKKEFARPEHLTREDLSWLQGIYDYAHSGVKAQFEKPGMFASIFKSNAKIDSFLSNIAGVISRGKAVRSDSEERNRGLRLEKALSGSAVLSIALDKSRVGKLQATDYAEIRRYIKANEALVKFIMARVEGDINLAYEAALDMKRIPLLSKKTVLVKPGMSLADQQELIGKITDSALKENVRTKEFSMSDLNEYKTLVTAPLKQQTDEKNAIRRLKNQMQSLHKFIMSPVSSSVNGNEAAMITFIQQYLKNPNKDPAEMAKNIRVLGSIFIQKKPALVDGLVGMLDGISTRPFKEWTFSEVSMLADYVDTLEKLGRATVAADRLAWSLNVKQWQRDVLGGIPNVKVQKGGSIEEDEQKKKFTARDLLEVPMMDIGRIASHFLDGNKKGVNYKILFDEMVYHQRSKLENIQARTGGITSFAETNNIDKHIHREIVVPGLFGIGGQSLRLTAGKLLGAYLMVGTKEEFNQHQREAFVYGNLFEQHEKFSLGDSGLSNLLMDRTDKVIAAAESMLTAAELEMGKMMMTALNDFGAWQRMASEIASFSGKEMGREKFYFPIKMVGPVSSAEDPIIGEFAKDSAFGTAISQGFVYDRSVNIAPVNRRAIDIDAMRIFYDSIKHQEHLVAFGGYVKKLKAIYGGNSSDSIMVQEKIRAAFGDGVMKAITTQIDTVCQPGDFHQKDISEKPFSLFRGGMVVANLSWRLSSVLMQLGTSPLPFLAEVNPIDLSRVALSAISSGNAIEWYKGIESRSAILKDRQMETIVELMRMADTGMEGRVKRFGDFGMRGLVFADRFSVAIGWEAVYQKKMRENVGEAEAKDYADKFVIRTQPSSEELYKSPLYKNMTTFKRVFLQFTQPMNVIYQNTFYDTQVMANEGDLNKAIATIAAYMVSGLAIGATAVMRGQKPEDEDKMLAFWLQQATGQFTGSVPIVGDSLNQFILSWMTGEPFRPFSDDNLPVVTNLFSALGEARKLAEEGSYNEEMVMKMSKFLFRGLGTMYGVPVRAAENITKIANEAAQGLLGN